MDITSSRTADALVVRPIGRIDETQWEAFRDALTTALDEAAASGLALVIDLGAVPYMSSRGLRVLTIARREAGERSTGIALARPSPQMREILAISRYDKIFEIHDTIQP